MSKKKTVSFLNEKIEFEGVVIDGCSTRFEIAKTCLKYPPSGGFDVEIMTKRMDLIKLVESDKEGVELDIKQVNYLRACFDAVKWPTIEQGVIDFKNYIDELKEKF